MNSLNQPPEQLARDNIDKLLDEAGWKVQHKKKINFNAGLRIAVREYDTDVGPADYVLFVDQKAVGVSEKRRSGPKYHHGRGAIRRLRLGQIQVIGKCMDKCLLLWHDKNNRIRV
ncbi:hypothetical protein UR09_05605 [Candidatus Nitromaritima sp. SCGC AAA799-A02]|nr:hypothetical protein UR09_05605 [Candidatus Nitromaritima sp. SCGC AAA799-A02]KMP10893.1 hypothetical protein UZ36_06200 [Candidatus Nitromaritima sp. SCGC AAA799-C22]